MLKIDSEIPIYKIGERVFRYGNFSYEKEFLKNIVSILDLGFKFVPHLFENELDFFYFLFFKIDYLTLDLNRKLFLNKINQTNNNLTTERLSVPRVHFENLSEDEDEIDLTNDYIDKINHLKSNKKKPNLENFPLQAEALFFQKIYCKDIF